MKKHKIIETSRIKVALRKDFHDVLKAPISELLDLTGADYFEHQIIKNYYQPNHFVSAFNTHEEWLDNYWANFWDNDPLERKLHKNAQINGLSFCLWHLSDPNSDCMKARMQMCRVFDGVAFAYQHKSGVLESFTIAWHKFDLERVDPKKLELIQEKLVPIRLHHHQVYQDLK